ncbi:hypothetical protein GCM10010116_40570 [Microbispora rosea subsp. aerata]|nr:hypothetical protein GCM10010116_40570 [Microbispora rosea subsp. aerata]GIH57102.1 hypothetical protein Mro02_40160 [Microbispora rosea subsp. aerata]GLJ83559.1 hypothetical protein GCM10017588_22870 [Microbispora rosea subsp. aerata]
MVFEPALRHGTRTVSGVAAPRPASTPERSRRFSASPASEPPYGKPDAPVIGLPALGDRDDGERPA